MWTKQANDAGLKILSFYYNSSNAAYWNHVSLNNFSPTKTKPKNCNVIWTVAVKRVILGLN